MHFIFAIYNVSLILTETNHVSNFFGYLVFLLKLRFKMFHQRLKHGQLMPSLTLPSDLVIIFPSEFIVKIYQNFALHDWKQ